MAFSLSNKPSGQHASRNCFQGTQPGTTYPEMCGGGNIAGKLIVVVRKPPVEASDQIVSHCTSLELKKRMCRLTDESMRKKSNTPCWPGVRPVISEVQAGGVKGGTMVRSPARAPSAKNDFKKGMTPWSMSGSRTEKVAPSRPMSRVRILIGPALWRPRPGGRQGGYSQNR